LFELWNKLGWWWCGCCVWELHWVKKDVFSVDDKV